MCRDHHSVKKVRQQKEKCGGEGVRGGLDKFEKEG